MYKIKTIAILGVGARGADAYGSLINKMTDKFKIVALCDLKQDRLDRFSKEFNVAKELCFTDENEFFREKRADLCLIATLDSDHVRHCIKAFEKGYDVMIEKPITHKLEECEAILKAQKKYGCKALVCHVLRYAPAFLKVAELIDNGEIGKLVCIEALERVAYWHQAHSYVRGNWRNTKIATPTILAKCCHDLDLLQFYAKSKCLSVSSVGDLTHFRKENQPEGAADRCVNCKYSDTCVYSAKDYYIDRWERVGCPEDIWPYNVVVDVPHTKAKLQKAMEEGPYGRCVYACDNDAVDHQIVQMTFENGVKASLTMTAFTTTPGRRIHFHGTHGEIILEETEESIYLNKYGQERQTINIGNLCEKGYGHGGGDYGLISALSDFLDGNGDANTSLEKSIESHLMGICAEESRLQGGKLIYLNEKR